MDETPRQSGEQAAGRDARDADLQRQFRAERDRRLREESRHYKERILPGSCFPDTITTTPELPPETTGGQSGALRAFAAGSCCGWRHPPTGEEIHSALHAAAPDRRQLAILAALTAELPPLEMIRAVREGACSLRQLARAVALTGSEPRNKWAIMNRWATEDIPAARRAD